jgi:XRE family transcriptional regulator, fatty acid utilization regulator
MIETDIGARVKALREGASLGQDALAGILGLENRQSVSDIELGKRRLSADELVTIVDHFGVSFEQLTNPFLLTGKESFSWRQRDVPLADLDAFEARAGEWIGAYRELNRLNDVPLKKLLPRLGLTHRSSFEEAVEAGEAVAYELELGTRPALALAATLEKRLGILVLMVDAIDGVSGAACRLRVLNVILINRQERASRRNSDLAHELFHILTWDEMRPERVESDLEAWERPATRSQHRNLRIENLADNFASGLLMPSRELDRIGEPQGNPVDWLIAAAR